MHVQQRHRLGPSGAPDRRSSPMDAPTLKELYESQLREELKCPPTPDFNRREMSCMLRVSRGMTPGALYGHDHAGTWVWSDLHLGHTKTIEAFRRPFGTADEMNDTIFRNWEQVVAPADTILILGDVTVHRSLGPTPGAPASVPGTEDPRVREPRDQQHRLGGDQWFRRSAQQLVRERRPAPTAHARAASSRPRRLREHSRPSTPQTRAGGGRDTSTSASSSSSTGQGPSPRFAGSPSASCSARPCVGAQQQTNWIGWAEERRHSCWREGHTTGKTAAPTPVNCGIRCGIIQIQRP